MSKSAYLLVFLLLFSSLTILLSETICLPADYSKIQSAIYAAVDDDETEILPEKMTL
ncbi:MAG: hypothetical protein K9N06_11820 [Candidatus Cloacimonetes bacterium]|nr:hypothetical protein [Candidatus Cloacimonadota bacterium]